MQVMTGKSWSLEVEVDLLLDALELLGDLGAAEEAAEVAAGLAGGDEHDGLPERPLQLLQRGGDPRVVPLHVMQEPPDRFHVLRQLPALVLVAPHLLRPLRHHADQTVGVHAGDLGHSRHRVHTAPYRHRLGKLVALPHRTPPSQALICICLAACRLRLSPGCSLLIYICRSAYTEPQWKHRP
ncbi:hypothetical protein DAI22_06g179103 [Oryza sativa Japonica Group]|nr:hypothetical protein DAI22_06g179103 [Oryza sativa Japonica Group]